MRERVTFLVSRPEDTDPKNCIPSPNELKILSLRNATREDRYTFDFSALPEKAQNFLRNIGQAHLVWSSGRFHNAQPPYSARVPAGLHIMTNPGWFESVAELLPAGEAGQPIEDSFLAAAWGLSDWSGNKTANTLRIGPWSQTFYSPVDSIIPFWGFMHKVFDGLQGITKTERFEWMRKLDRLTTADYLDIQYDVGLKKVEVSTYWGSSDVDWSGWMVGNAEIGILGEDQALKEEHLKLGGFIYEVEGGEPGAATTFTFPHRHHRAPSSFTLTTNTPTGLHPTLHLTIPGPPAPPRKECTLNAYFTLPASVFVDKYQLSSTNVNLLQQLGLRQLRDVTGNTDLEAPEYSLPTREWGSRVLIELDPEALAGEPLEAEIPLHTRYLKPRENSTAEAVIAWPSVFWACGGGSPKLDRSPFDRIGLGWEDQFPGDTVYYHLSPAPAPVVGARASGTWVRIEVPVLDSSNANMILMGTVAAVALGFVSVVGAVLWSKASGKEVKKEVKKEKKSQ